MSAEKSELRAAAVFDLGSKLDDELEKLRGLMNRVTGEVKAAGKINEGLTTIVKDAQSKIDAGELSLEEGKLVIKWITRAQNACAAYGEDASGRALKAEGMVLGMTVAVESTSKAHKSEQARHIRDGDVPAPAVVNQGVVEDGGRMSIKQRRLAEEAAAKKKTAKKKTAKKKRSSKKKTAKKA
jgi:hypothetical protein